MNCGQLWESIKKAKYENNEVLLVSTSFVFRTCSKMLHANKKPSVVRMLKIYLHKHKSFVLSD